MARVRDGIPIGGDGDLNTDTLEPSDGDGDGRGVGGVGVDREDCARSLYRAASATADGLCAAGCCHGAAEAGAVFYSCAGIGF